MAAASAGRTESRGLMVSIKGADPRGKHVP